MEIAELKAEKREQVGKESSKKLRRQGMVPAVVYSGGTARTITVNQREFATLAHTAAGTHVIVKLAIAGEKARPNAIIKEIQHNPLRNEYFHIDFQEIALNEKIQAMVPVTPVGEAPAIKEGGILERHLAEIQLEGLPGDMPDHIEVDISELHLGQNLHVSDLKIPAGAVLLSDPEEVLLTIGAPRGLAVETTAVEGIAPEQVAGGGETAASKAAEEE